MVAQDGIAVPVAVVGWSKALRELHRRIGHPTTVRKPACSAEVCPHPIDDYLRLFDHGVVTAIRQVFHRVLL
jgi:hypothetical protein